MVSCVMFKLNLVDFVVQLIQQIHNKSATTGKVVCNLSTTSRRDEMFFCGFVVDGAINHISVC